MTSSRRQRAAVIELSRGGSPPTERRGADDVRPASPPAARRSASTAPRRAPRPSRAPPARCPTRGSAPGRSSPSSRSTSARRSASAAVRLPVGARPQAHVDQRLRKEVDAGEQVGERPAASGRPPRSTISALTMPSPVVWRSSASRWPEPSPPSCQPRCEQLLEDVAVADLGAHDVDAAPAQRLLDAEVGHQRADDARAPAALVEAVGGHHVEQLVAVVEAAGAVDDLQPVGVAVERDAVVGTAGAHRVDERLRRGRAEAGVDVEAVGPAADRR